MPTECATGNRTSNLHGWGPTLWPLCYRNLAFKAFCLLIISLCPGCKGLGLAWVAASKNHFFQALFFFLHCSYETQRSPALQKTSKNNFLGSTFFFPHCSHETQTSPALQKTSKNNVSFYFSHASCQICQLHRVTSFKLAPNCADACNTYLRML